MLGDTERNALVKELEQIAVFSAYYAAYMDADDDHVGALKAANKARRSVREALGYSVTHDIKFP